MGKMTGPLWTRGHLNKAWAVMPSVDGHPSPGLGGMVISGPALVGVSFRAHYPCSMSQTHHLFPHFLQPNLATFKSEYFFSNGREFASLCLSHSKFLPES